MTRLALVVLVVALLVFDLFLLAVLTPRAAADEPTPNGIRVADEDFQPWPGPTEVVVPVPVPTVRAAVATSPLFGTTGTVSTYGPGYDGLLALPLPWGRGWAVRICGPGGCVSGVSNDTGPVRSLGRIADLDVATFERVCGMPWMAGLCTATVTVTGRR